MFRLAETAYGGVESGLEVGSVGNWPGSLCVQRPQWNAMVFSHPLCQVLVQTGTVFWTGTVFFMLCLELDVKSCPCEQDQSQSCMRATCL